MALTRAALREMGVTEKEIIDAIMTAHGDTIESTKEKLETAAQKKIDALQAKVDSLPDNSGNEKLQSDYEKLKSEFDTYKTDVKNKEMTAAQNKALHEALKAAGANEKFISLVIDKVDRSKAVFDGDIEKGFTVKNSDDIVKPVKEQYGDIFGTVTTQGAGIATPPKTDATKPAGHKDMNAFIRGVVE